jgi:4'-phosphopantetheinyl transferase
VPLELNAGEIQLWSRAIEPVCELDWELLNGEERARADRFLVEHARSAFVATRSALRRLASGYLGVPAGDLNFGAGPQGKPYLTGSPARLKFNVSHTAGLAVLGFAWDAEIGVDVERLRPMEDMDAIAARFFAATEVSELRSVEGSEERTAAFYRCWTRKEAYIKAVGGGLSIPLDGFHVAFLEGEAPAVSVPGWVMHAWVPEAGYVAATAVNVQAPTVTPWFHQRQWLDAMRRTY